MWSMLALVALGMCVPCHAAIVGSYSKTGMARSFYRLTDPRRVEDFTRNNRFFHQASQSWYEMEQRQDRFYMRRRTGGYVMEKEIHYVLGSGNHTRSYVHMTSQGRLLALIGLNLGGQQIQQVSQGMGVVCSKSVEQGIEQLDPLGVVHLRQNRPQ